MDCSLNKKNTFYFVAAQVKNNCGKFKIYRRKTKSSSASAAVSNMKRTLRHNTLIYLHIFNMNICSECMMLLSLHSCHMLLMFLGL